MDKSKRQKGKIKKGLSKKVPRNLRKSKDLRTKPRTSSIVPVKPKAKVATVPKSHYISVYREMLKFLQSNSKCIRVKHRDQEKNMLLSFIQDSFDIKKSRLRAKSRPSVMIVFGQAGLGKTLLLHDILNDLHGSLVRDFMKPKKFLDMEKTISVFYFNSMSFDYPRDLLISILKQMFQHIVKVGREDDPSYYLQLFKKKLKKILLTTYIIVMVDELDHLYYKCPTQFYTLIEFFNISTPGFVKIGIANTLNFVTNVSGTFMLLNINFMIFKPYSVEQLKDILLDRLQAAAVNHKINWQDQITLSGIELLVKKVISNNSSDVRFLLSSMNELIQNKIEVLSRNRGNKTKTPNLQQITALEILTFIKSKTKRRYLDLTPNLSFQQQLILLAICGLIKQEALFINKSDVKMLYKKLLKSFEIEDRIKFDVLLDNLVVYSFVKIFKDSKHVIIKSELGKPELKACLSENSLLKRELDIIC